jgi:hypothetical protein
MAWRISLHGGLIKKGMISARSSYHMELQFRNNLQKLDGIRSSRLNLVSNELWKYMLPMKIEILG